MRLDLALQPPAVTPVAPVQPVHVASHDNKVWQHRPNIRSTQVKGNNVEIFQK